MKQSILHYEFSQQFKTLIVPLFCCALLTYAQSSAQSYFPVIPGLLADDSFSTIPFSGGSNTVRFQQIYDAAGFIEEGGSRPFLIHSIRFRKDAEHPGFFSQFPDFQINLSTAVRPVDSMSLVFSENVGIDDNPIIGRGAFELGTRSGPSFGVIIDLAIPFLYDPLQGNLLIDVRNFGGGRTTWGVPPFMGPAYVDASNVLGDRVSSVSGPVESLSGTTSTRGLVTQFRITPLPTLTLSLQSSNLLFRWIHQQGPFLLQQSARLGPGAAWQLAGGIERTNGAYKEVTLPLNTNVSAGFFRLILPPASSALPSAQTSITLGTLSKQEP